MTDRKDLWAGFFDVAGVVLWLVAIGLAIFLAVVIAFVLLYAIALLITVN